MNNPRACCIGITLAIAICAPAALAGDDLIAAAMASEQRTEADRERDARARPEVILKLLDLQLGQAVVGLFAGGGYYSELLAGVAGLGGTVILQNNYGYAKWADKYLKER